MPRRISVGCASGRGGSASSFRSPASVSGPSSSRRTPPQVVLKSSRRRWRGGGGAAAGGAQVEPETLAWWEAYGTLRWAVICVQQAAMHLSGAVRSIELAVIGRRVCEVELDLLDLLAPADPLTPDPAGPREDAEDADPGPHGRPTAHELLDATRE